MCRYISKIVFLLVVLYSCNNKSATTSTSDSTKNQAALTVNKAMSNLNDTITEKIVTVLEKYYDLKNSLVRANEVNTDSSAARLCFSARKLQGYMLTNDAPGPLKPFIDTIIIQSETITGIKDNTCEKQRLEFSTLSNAIYQLVKLSGLKNVHIYQQHCPMAFNEKGANWLSNESDIKNPYYGDKMLECGELIDSIQ